MPGMTKDSSMDAHIGENVTSVDGLLSQALKADVTPRYLSVFEQMPCPAVIVAADASVERMNGAARRLASRQVGGLASIGDGGDVDALPWLRNDVARFLRGSHAEMQLETEVDLDGSICYFQVLVTRLRVPSSGGDGAIVLLTDITDKRLYQRELDHRTHHDALTGFPNRALFGDRLSHSLALARRERRSLAVMAIDMDRFKDVNDTVGHKAGDALLKRVSRRLARCLREADTFARMGGDEFAVILHDARGPEEAELVARRILASLSRVFVVEDREFYLSASVGVSRFPADGADGDTLFRNSSAALYRAKQVGRNSYQVYSPEMNAGTAERLTIENRLRKAVENDELQLWYQPIVELATGRILGCEALLRWPNAENGFTPPSMFIPVAEETGLIVPLGEFVLLSACTKSREWADKGYDVGIAVNLSARNLRRGDLANIITRVLAETGASAERLRIEITETTLMDDPDAVSALLLELKSMGISISLDDFGTGYSSLQYLKRLPIDTLKIARTFVSHVTTSQDDAVIADAILAMAKALNLTVVAEGVETQDQLAFFRERGCDEMQGFLVSPAVPADDFAEMLSRGYWLDGVLPAAKGAGS